MSDARKSGWEPASARVDVVRVEPTPEGGAGHFGVREWERLVRFGELLVEQGELRGLIGPRELDRLWSRHLLNSTAVSEFVPNGMRIADVGAGAGFPGMVLAIIRPDLDVDLIEPMERRTDWLQFVTDELALENVNVIRARAEDLPKLLRWTLPLLKPGGRLVALKGQRAEIEVAEAEKQLRKYRAQSARTMDVDVWGTDEGTRVVEVVKMK